MASYFQLVYQFGYKQELKNTLFKYLNADLAFLVVSLCQNGLHSIFITRTNKLTLESFLFIKFYFICLNLGFTLFQVVFFFSFFPLFFWFLSLPWFNLRIFTGQKK